MGELLETPLLRTENRDTANAVYVFGMAAAGDAVSCINFTAVTLVFLFCRGAYHFQELFKNRHRVRKDLCQGIQTKRKSM